MKQEKNKKKNCKKTEKKPEKNQKKNVLKEEVSHRHVQTQRKFDFVIVTCSMDFVDNVSDEYALLRLYLRPPPMHLSFILS